VLCCAIKLKWFEHRIKSTCSSQVSLSGKGYKQHGHHSYMPVDLQMPTITLNFTNNFHCKYYLLLYFTIETKEEISKIFYSFIPWNKK
jgi:hypothetical protein